MKNLFLFLIVLFIPLMGMSQENSSAPDFYNVLAIQTCQDSLSEPSDTVMRKGIIEFSNTQRYIEVTFDGYDPWKYVLIEHLSEKRNEGEYLWKIKNVANGKLFYLYIVVSLTDHSYVKWEIITPEFGFLRMFSKEI